MRATVVLLLVVCLFAQVVFSADPATGPAECKKKVKQVLKKIFKGNTACEREMDSHKLTKEQFLEQRGCLAKCTLRKANILHDDTQIVTEDTVKMAVIENVHPDFKDKATTTVIKCLHEHKADKMDPKDPKCMGYADLKQCIQDNVSEVCGDPPIFRRRR